VPEFPVIRFPAPPFAPFEKVPAVAAYVGLRPAVWIDDELTPQARAWARDRGVPTLLIDADPAVGLTRAAVDEALQWALGNGTDLDP
jgi:hypothetical protein